jgi:hypothetical protein
MRSCVSKGGAAGLIGSAFVAFAASHGLGGVLQAGYTPQILCVSHAGISIPISVSQRPMGDARRFLITVQSYPFRIS